MKSFSGKFLWKRSWAIWFWDFRMSWSNSSLFPCMTLIGWESAQGVLFLHGAVHLLALEKIFFTECETGSYVRLRMIFGDFSPCILISFSLSWTEETFAWSVMELKSSICVEVRIFFTIPRKEVESMVFRRFQQQIAAVNVIENQHISQREEIDKMCDERQHIIILVPNIPIRGRYGWEVWAICPIPQNQHIQRLQLIVDRNFCVAEATCACVVRHKTEEVEDRTSCQIDKRSLFAWTNQFSQIGRTTIQKKKSNLRRI